MINWPILVCMFLNTQLKKCIIKNYFIEVDILN